MNAPSNFLYLAALSRELAKLGPWRKAIFRVKAIDMPVEDLRLIKLPRVDTLRLTQGEAAR